MVQNIRGSNPSAYLGVYSVNPPDFYRFPRDPTPNDAIGVRGYTIGDFWENSKNFNLWFLAANTGKFATWIMLGLGTITKLQASDGTQAVPVAGIVIFPDQLIPGAGTVDSNLQSNVTPNLDQNFVMNLKPTVKLPNSNIGLSQGAIWLGGNGFLHGYGTANAFVGNAAGNTSLTVVSAVQNSGFGNGVLQGLTTGHSNTALGANSLPAVSSGINNSAAGSATLSSLTTGSSNTALGANVFSQAGGNITTGSNNIGIGAGSGDSYVTGSESNNIVINHTGVNGESNVIRIGTQGGGAGQQNMCFVAGITGVTVTGSLVVCDGTGQLGTTAAAYTIWTAFTPTLTGGTVAGATTYSTQTGLYKRIDDMVIIKYNIVITAATGTGDMVIGNLPFTVNDTGGNAAVGPCLSSSVAWPASVTQVVTYGINATVTAKLYGTGSTIASTFVQMANSALGITGTLIYKI